MSFKTVYLHMKILELENETILTVDNINRQYRHLAKIYHPDVSENHHKDGENFILINDARNYRMENLDFANQVLKNKINNTTSEQYFDEQQYDWYNLYNENLRKQQEEYYQKIYKKEAKKRVFRRVVKYAIYVLIFLLGGSKV